MPVAARPDPLLTIASANAGPQRPPAGGPLAGPGSFSNVLAQASPSPRDLEREPVREPQRPADPSAPAAQDRQADASARPQPGPSTAHALPKRATGDANRAAARSGPATERGATATEPKAIAEEACSASAAPAKASGEELTVAKCAAGDPSANAALPQAAAPAAPAAPEAAGPLVRLLANPNGVEAQGTPETDPNATEAVAARTALRPIAAHLPAAITRPAPQVAGEPEVGTDDEPVPDASLAARAPNTPSRRASGATTSVDTPAPAPRANAPTAEVPLRSTAALASELRALSPVREGGPSRSDAVVNALAGWTATGSAPTGTTPTAPTAVAQVAPPLDHPDFAQALGTQVAVWAADGQHEAELHLNPGSMGPVQVWIGIEGAQAQVRFSADLAPTREALQAALPQLEQALAREGLQLGGAHVQARDAGAGQGGSAPGGGEPGDPRRGRGSVRLDAPEPLLPGQRPPGPARGLLDLYA